MPTPAPVRPRFLPRLAPFALTLAFAFLAASDASAQSGGPFQRYSERWYGQNFYDHQRNGVFVRIREHRQYSGGYYGPAMLYGRQYGEQYGNLRDTPDNPRRQSPMTEFGGYTGSY